MSVSEPEGRGAWVSSMLRTPAQDVQAGLRAKHGMRSAEAPSNPSMRAKFKRPPDF